MTNGRQRNTQKTYGYDVTKETYPERIARAEKEEACDCTMSRLQDLWKWCKNVTFGDKTAKNVKKQ